MTEDLYDSITIESNPFYRKYFVQSKGLRTYIKCSSFASPRQISWHSQYYFISICHFFVEHACMKAELAWKYSVVVSRRALTKVNLGPLTEWTTISQTALRFRGADTALQAHIGKGKRSPNVTCLSTAIGTDVMKNYSAGCRGWNPRPIRNAGVKCSMDILIGYKAEVENCCMYGTAAEVKISWQAQLKNR